MFQSINWPYFKQPSPIKMTMQLCVELIHTNIKLLSSIVFLFYSRKQEGITENFKGILSSVSMTRFYCRRVNMLSFRKTSHIENKNWLYVNLKIKLYQCNITKYMVKFCENDICKYPVCMTGCVVDYINVKRIKICALILQDKFYKHDIIQIKLSSAVMWKWLRKWCRDHTGRDMNISPL